MSERHMSIRMVDDRTEAEVYEEDARQVAAEPVLTWADVDDVQDRFGVARTRTEVSAEARDRLDELAAHHS